MALFVTFEGPEGSGKTTQLRLLYRYVQTRELAGKHVVCTREPGGTPIGEQIRTVLHDVDNKAMLPITEILLYSASRAQHVGEVLRPALERGDIVLCDRYAEATMAYQGYGRGLDLHMLRVITDFATGGLRPDLIIYLDIDVRLGLQRKYRDLQEGRGEWNRMDQQDLAFHQRVRDGYLQMAKHEPERWLVIDATQSAEIIHEIIRKRVERSLTSSS